jgi:hypothetical protein
MAGREQAIGVSRGSPVFRLLVAYALLLALLDLFAALPGNPSFSSTRGLVATIVIQSLLVWRLSRGSAIAWWFALFLAIWSLLAITLMGIGLGWTSVLIRVMFAAQAGVLLAPPLRSFVRSRRHSPPTAA